MLRLKMTSETYSNRSQLFPFIKICFEETSCKLCYVPTSWETVVSAKALKIK